ncbi:hypothetical protein WJX82_006334 [Trebouxia sp. C0006]
MQVNIGSALAGAAQLFLSPATSQLSSTSWIAHTRGSQRSKCAAIVACTAAAAGCSLESAAKEIFKGAPTGSVCSPPHTSHFTRRAVAPAHCIAPSKTRRRRRPFGGGDPGDHDEDFGIPGGNDGDSGSTGGGGGGDWGSDGGEEGGYFGDLMGALWLWRALCVCSVLQVIHFMLLAQHKQDHPAFATVSQSFFSSGVRVQPAGASG